MADDSDGVSAPRGRSRSTAAISRASFTPAALSTMGATTVAASRVASASSTSSSSAARPRGSIVAVPTSTSPHSGGISAGFTRSAGVTK